MCEYNQPQWRVAAGNLTEDSAEDSQQKWVELNVIVNDWKRIANDEKVCHGFDVVQGRQVLVTPAGVTQYFRTLFGTSELLDGC